MGVELLKTHIALGNDWTYLLHDGSGTPKPIEKPKDLPELKELLFHDLKDLLSERYGKPCVEKNSPSDIIARMRAAGFRGNMTF